MGASKFGCSDASQVLKGIEEFLVAHFDCDMRLDASGWIDQVRMVSFVVHYPGVVAVAVASDEKG